MPAKNSVKVYADRAYQHIYNRGVEKRLIFLDDQDKNVLRSYIATYLMPKNTELLTKILVSVDTTSKEKDTARKLLCLNNYAEEIDLLSHCLMPNHFHFLLFQKEAHSIDHFMSSLWNRYTVYFNRKYRRVGGLFQGVYKGVSIESDEQLIYTTRYIHRNPKPVLPQGDTLRSHEWSSYPEYLGERQTPWVKTEAVLSFFSKKGKNSYQSFVEDDAEDEMESMCLVGLQLDDGEDIL